MVSKTINNNLVRSSWLDSGGRGGRSDGNSLVVRIGGLARSWLQYIELPSARCHSPQRAGIQSRTFGPSPTNSGMVTSGNTRRSSSNFSFRA